MSYVFAANPARARRGLIPILAVAVGLFVAAEVTAAQFTLSWSDNSTNETGFRIERSTGGAGFAEIAMVGANVVAYIDAGLPNATSFSYRLRAYNSAGNSGYSNVATGTTPPPSSNNAPTISDIANQTVNAGAGTGALAVTIGDVETAAGSLTLSKSSSNTTLVPAANIVLGGSGSSRTVTVTPASGQTGTATITLTVSDGSLTASDSFVVTVNTANTAPTITDTGNRTINEDTSTGTIAFTIGDGQTAAGSLTVTRTSSNTTLVPTANIVLGGSGTSRTATITPAANQSGTATITITVSDGSLTASDNFVLTVSAVNDAPTISNIADRTVAARTSTGSISFTVGDAETSAGSLAVTASSSNQTLVPDGSITLGGSGSSRTLALTPPTSTAGTATITVRVSDGALATVDMFVVTVTTANAAPTITAIPAQNVALNGTTNALPFTIGDAETAAASLTLSASSTNTGLIPLGNITLGGSGASRTVTIRPLSNTTGSSTIAITVSDGTLKTTTSFVVNVSAQLTYGDIGAPSIAGSQTISGATITLRAGGADIWGRSDQFRFGRTQLAGDSELTVRVASLTKSHAWAKAGLMFRGSTSANAAYVFVCITPSSGVALQYRASAGANAVHKYSEAAVAPRWLKLTRTGDTFYAFHSSDGVTWDLVDSVTVDLPDTVPAGLAVTSHNTKTATTATFDSLSVD